MAANTSARKLQLEALNAQASDYGHCFLTVDCGAEFCERERTYPVGGLAGVYPDLKLGEIIRRMKCHAYGGALVSARLQTARPGQKHGRWVELVGPAAWGPKRD